VLNLEVQPSATTYKPGEKATVRVRLTGPDGKPYVGSIVLSMYDKAVEYISGGSNVPDIKSFFWKWRRRHNPVTETSLNRGSGNLLRPKEAGMQFLGVFGRTVADENREGGQNTFDFDGHASIRKMEARGDDLSRSEMVTGAVMAMSAPMPAAADAKGGGGGATEAAVVEPTVRHRVRGYSALGGQPDHGRGRPRRSQPHHAGRI